LREAQMMWIRRPPADQAPLLNHMQELNLSHRTVEIFVHQAVRRLQAKTRAHAVAIAIRGGTI